MAVTDIVQKNIFFVGAGRVGKTLSFFFRKKGFLNVSLFNRSNFSEVFLFKKEGISVFVGELYGSFVSEADIVFLTVKDDAIFNVYERISKYLKKDAVVFNTSGCFTFSEKIFQEEKLNFLGSMHPPFSFSGFINDVSRLENSLIFAIEGGKNAIFIAKEILKQLKLPYFVLKTEDKISYHTALSIISQGVGTSYLVAQTIFDSIKIEKSLSKKVLNLLLDSAVFNLKKVHDSFHAITGPAVRKDFTTLNKHKKLLKNKFSDFVNFYESITSIIVNKSEKNSQGGNDKK